MVARRCDRGRRALQAPARSGAGRAMQQRAMQQRAIQQRDLDVGNLRRCPGVRSRMSLPLAHALVGGSIGVALWPEHTPAGFRRALVTGALLGVCPDADYLLSRLHVLGWGWHHGFTHSVVFAVVAGAAASWWLGLRGWRGALACVLAALSHTLLDYLVTESPGVALWWPLTARRYKLGIDELSYYHLMQHGSERVLAFAKLCVAELLLFGPVLAFAVRATRRRFRA
jgi:hypothetical protein